MEDNPLSPCPLPPETGGRGVCFNLVWAGMPAQTRFYVQDLSTACINKNCEYADFVDTILLMSDEMKKCKYCGREIGKDATFCWYCGRELEARPERPEVPPQNKTSRWLLTSLAVVLVVIVLVILIAPLLRP